MSPKLPSLTGKELVRVALKAGFVFRRQTGSHAVYVRQSDKTRIVIPLHAGKTLKRKTLHGIIRDMKMTTEEFARLLI